MDLLPALHHASLMTMHVEAWHVLLKSKRLPTLSLLAFDPVAHIVLGYLEYIRLILKMLQTLPHGPNDAKSTSHIMRALPIVVTKVALICSRIRP